MEVLESVMSSDDSCDSEMKSLKSQLNEFGLDEENLSKEEMSDLIKALNNSKCSIREEEILHQKVEASGSKSPKKYMKRKYLNVRDRRMPWSMFPSTITQAEKARTLAVYIKLMSINNYRQARKSTNFVKWPPAIEIVDEASRTQSLRSTRSGRVVPVYAEFDDDSSDLDITVTKTKKRKISTSENAENYGVYTNQVHSLKKKTKEEEVRPPKEPKLTPGNDVELNGSEDKTIKVFLSMED